MNRNEWQQLADRWVADAKALLDARRWSAAYYVTGYAVECGLKACVLKRLADTPEVIFGERRFSEKCWTHDLVALLELTGLEATWDADQRKDPQLAKNWIVVKDWNERSRYASSAHKPAKKLYTAVTDDPSGVLTWIKRYW